MGKPEDNTLTFVFLMGKPEDNTLTFVFLRVLRVLRGESFF
jgi:hypothetical protein